jgi:hypothetical protein
VLCGRKGTNVLKGHSASILQVSQAGKVASYRERGKKLVVGDCKLAHFHAEEGNGMFLRNVAIHVHGSHNPEDRNINAHRHDIFKV